jgi:DNA-binding transcriptional ArsR family regulator
MLNSLITSKTRLRVLVKFFIRAANKGHLNALASEFGESTNGVRKELNKLKDAGYLISNKEQNKVIYRANTEHPLYSVLQQLVKKHLRLDEMVEAIVKRIGDVQKIILIGDYAKGIDSGLIEVLLIAKNINENYIIELEKKLKVKLAER